MSSIVSVRMNKKEADILQQAASFYGCAVSSLLKKLALEKLEDDFDLVMIAKYEDAKKAGTVETKPIETLFNELNI